MVNVRELERKLKAKDLGEEETGIVQVVGRASAELDEHEEPTGKILVPVNLNGGKQRYTFKMGEDSIDAVSLKLGEETADWIGGEIGVSVKTAEIGKEKIAWVVANSARSTKFRDDRLAALKKDEQSSLLGKEPKPVPAELQMNQPKK